MTLPQRPNNAPIVLDKSLENRIGINLGAIKWELQNLQGQERYGKAESIAEYWGTTLTLYWLERLDVGVAADGEYQNLAQLLVDGLPEDVAPLLLEDAKRFIEAELEGEKVVLEHTESHSQ